ncbi:MAG: glutamate racemase [Thermoanaerobaculia bacterium]
MPGRERAAAGDARPIGVFDSGIGGLTVVAALMRRLPGESILYLGDTARLPYGSKSAQTVARYAHRNIDFLRSRGVKAVIIACNTASALAGEALDGPVPVWGVIEPGAEAAIASSAGHRIGVIATAATIRSDAYGRAIRRLDPGAEVLGHACPLFVPLVEEGWGDDPVTVLVARRYLEPLLASGIDCLVLGCTHYPVLVPVLRRIVGEDVAIVDSAETMARKAAHELAAAGLLASGGPAGGRPAGGRPAEHHFCVTDASEGFQRLAIELLPMLGDRMRLEWVEV